MSTHPIPVLLYEIIQDLRARNPDRIPLIGVAGAQGSGKSYQCRILSMANQPRFAHFSLDDVYRSRAEREELATETHPLFITRGRDEEPYEARIHQAKMRGHGWPPSVPPR